MATIEQIRRISYIGRAYGLKIPVRPVCRGHSSPGEILAALTFDHEPLSLTQGPRGGGKSAVCGGGSIHFGNIIYPRYDAKILGGSLSQSAQIYNALKMFRDACPDADIIEELNKTVCKFKNGSQAEMLSASPKSVRGPHIPRLLLDEVDEIDPEILEHAMGMVMEIDGLRAAVAMMSTWHKLAGPMAELMKRGQQGEFPVRTFCMFDVLERCPVERSGPAPEYKGCQTCPIQQWCHADIHETGLPKAKRSCGHYTIDAFIQKATAVGKRVFESDYLCYEPRAAGQWFTGYDENLHVTEMAEYRRDEQVHVAIDPGVHTGAVFFQTYRSRDGRRAHINVFGDYYAEFMSAEANALAIVELNRHLTGRSIQHHVVSMDQSARQATQTGHIVITEYRNAGCCNRENVIRPWPPIGPGRPKAETLALLEALVRSADGSVSILIHPRCEHLRNALKSYVRDKSSSGQWLDKPKDPQHPHENLIDALTGGLLVEFPLGIASLPQFKQVRVRDFV